MTKISTYTQITSLASTDLFLATDASDSNATKNIPLSALTDYLEANLEFANITVTSLSEYADNAAAKVGGLTDGEFYRTSDGTVKVVYT